ncbi:MAG: YihA family ribosome biogenesis GTP-binding protein [Candidatus Lambdaproteobacteria bacterium]|nr:YihA family ribosome biogenesis GTP-binding protein [Candidatus Lambdaproteobacteria bacterium]
MIVHTAEFVIGAAAARQFPTSVLPEVAFAGKSNVGKSSLINSLLNRKRLVKTSRTPGKTREINFFLINGSFHLVDLPGYGYARVAHAQREEWGRHVVRYLAERGPLAGVVLIVDARHPPSPLDRSLRELLRELGRPLVVVANKVDKLSRSQINPSLARAAAVLEPDEPVLPYSSVTHAGRAALWARLGEWIGPGEPPR